MDASKARVAELRLNRMVASIMSENEAIALQSNVRFGDKYREMYSILKVLEEYLKFNSCDGNIGRVALRKKLKEMLETL
jgi:hypothetical protein